MLLYPGAACHRTVRRTNAVRQRQFFGAHVSDERLAQIAVRAASRGEIGLRRQVLCGGRDRQCRRSERACGAGERRRLRRHAGGNVGRERSMDGERRLDERRRHGSAVAANDRVQAGDGNKTHEDQETHETPRQKDCVRADRFQETSEPIACGPRRRARRGALRNHPAR